MKPVISGILPVKVSIYRKQNQQSVRLIFCLTGMVFFLSRVRSVLTGSEKTKNNNNKTRSMVRQSACGVCVLDGNMILVSSST